MSEERKGPAGLDGSSNESDPFEIPEFLDRRSSRNGIQTAARIEKADHRAIKANQAKEPNASATRNRAWSTRLIFSAPPTSS